MIGMNANLTSHKLRAGMIGMGMIFDDTYRPFFEHAHASGMYRRDFGYVDVELSAVASRTGSRAEKYRGAAGDKIASFVSFAGADATRKLLAHGVDAVCVATPDDRHFESAKLALEAGKHVLIEKPSVLTLQELDALET
ncbi:MAG: Gfo/Idh/MocA family protein, partial [Thermomicrobiales bacterium]